MFQIRHKCCESQMKHVLQIYQICIKQLRAFIRFRKLHFSSIDLSLKLVLSHKVHFRLYVSMLASNFTFMQ